MTGDVHYLPSNVHALNRRRVIDYMVPGATFQQIRRRKYEVAPKSSLLWRGISRAKKIHLLAEDGSDPDPDYSSAAWRSAFIKISADPWLCVPALLRVCQYRKNHLI
jgi:hypothetical protein